MAAACSNHSTTASVSSSTSSLRNRRLEDIAESTEEIEESEEDTDPDSKRRNLTPAPPYGKRPKSPLATEVVLSETDEDYEHSIHQTLTSNSLSPPSNRDSTELRRESTSGTTKSEQLLTTEQLAELAAQKLLNELYPHLKQKVRLGPRPSLEASRRPHTAGSGKGSKGEFKPVAALPRSLQGKKTSKDSRDKRSKGVEEAKTEDFAIATPITEQNLPSITGTLSVTDPYLPPRTADSSTSLTPSLSVLSPASSPAPSEPGVLSPEKQKLMRALQLRRKTMAPPSIDVQAPPAVEKAVEKTVTDEPEKVAEKVVEEMESVEEKQGEPIAIKAVDSTDEKTEELNTEESGNTVREQVVEKPADSDVEEGAVKDTGVGEAQKEAYKEVEPEIIRSKPIDIITLEKPEGTKVRGSESDYESDSEESEAAVEIAVAEHHPITPLRDAFAPSSPDSSLSSTPKSPVLRTINIPPPDNKPTNNIVVTKRGGRETEPEESEAPPPIPPARSVSAPFVGTAAAARRQSATPVMARKVNASNGGGGGGSSVLQRIRQLEQIANSKAPSPAGVPSGLSPQVRSVTPTFPMKAAGLKPSSGFPAPHPSSVIDRSESRTAPPRHDWPRRTGDLPSLSNPSSQEFKPRFTGTSLQVTTKIMRDIERPATSLEVISPGSGDRRASVDMSMLNTSFAGPSQPRIDTPPRSLSPATPVIKKSESRSFFKSAPKSPSIDPKGTSPTSPAESKKSFFKDKDEKKKSKAPSTHEEPKKSPVLPLLRRMSSSLSWRSKDKETPETLSVPTPAEVPEPLPSPKPKSYLLAGWVNVQLPDTLVSPPHADPS